MSTFPCYILLFFFLHQRILAADGGTNRAKTDKDKCNPTIIKQLSETMDLVCEVNSRLNNTELYLDQLKKELFQNRDSTDAVQEQLKKHLEKDQQIQDALSKVYEHLSGTEHKIRQNNNYVALGPRDCSDIRAMGFTASGLYTIYAGGDDKRMRVNVYCDFSSFKESWLVFQRRMDGSENFERSYTQYECGFGNLNGEFWLGNEVLHLLTKNRQYKLRIDLEDFAGEKRYAEYTTFHVNSTTDFYRLTVADYFGNAGDSLKMHNKMRFSTQDIDNDLVPRESCAKKYHGAWWYNNCHQSHLNGLYLRGPHKSFADGIEWNTWHGMYYSLKKTEMKLVPLEDLKTLVEGC